MADIDHIKVGGTEYTIKDPRSSFPPSSHDHNYLKSYGSYSSSDTAWTTIGAALNGAGLATANVDATGSPCNNDGVLINAFWTAAYGFQIWGDDGSGQGGLMHRNRNGSGWNSWQTIPLVGNGTTRGCGSATQPVYVGSDGHIEACTAYSSASVNYANSAGAVAWGNVSGRPTALSSFTNDSGYITSSGSCSYASSSGSASKLAYSTTATTEEALNSLITASCVRYDIFQNMSGFAGNDGMVLTIGWPNSTAYGFQIAMDDSTTGLLKIRGKGDSWGAWHTVIDSNNISSQSVNYASSAGNADTLDGSHASAFAAASHTHSYLPLSGGTVSGLIQAYRYTVSNSLPAITLDKPGSYAVGIGPDGTNQRVRFGPVNGMSGTSWVSDASQFTFYFDGKVQATNSFVGDLSGTATSATQIQGNAVTFKDLVVYNGSSSTTYKLVCKS